MSGLGGGALTATSLRTLGRAIEGQTSETSWKWENHDAGLCVQFPSADTGSVSVWHDRHRGGVVYGAITNLDELGLAEEQVFERLLAGDRTLPAALEGGFLLACHDGTDDRWILVTDKLGSRPCYYLEDGKFRFADSVSALLPSHPDPATDTQAVSDLLLMGHLWGDRTLVEGIRAIRPATVLEARDGVITTRRYWRPDYSEAAADSAYLDELARRYRQAAQRTARTLPTEAGIWLSGGLDSRTTAAAVVETIAEPGNCDRLRAYTYDANPPTRDNPRIAGAVCDRLDIPHEEVSLTADSFDAAFERVIDATDGMLQWNVLANLSVTYNIEGPPPVMLEGMPGELVGDHPFRYHLESDSPVRAQYHSEGSASPAQVERLLTGVDVDPFATFRAEARRSPEATHRATVLDTHFQNYYSRSVLLSDEVLRERLGSRTVQVDGDYLEWCAKLPHAFRKGTFPFSRRFVQADAGGVPLGTSRAKLGLCRRVAPQTVDVPYERTKVRPDRPYPLHAVGFVGNVIVNRLRGRATYGNGQLSDVWIRDRETRLHDRVAGLVDDACDRRLFDADAVREIYDAHMAGANNAGLLAKITTLEYWLGTHLD